MEKKLSGKPVADLVTKATEELIAKYKLMPHMLLIQLGADPASNYYVQSIINNGEKQGCKCELLTLPETTTQTELLAVIQAANLNPDIHGIMLQKPLPATINDHAINTAISPEKDIDCLSPQNLGKILMEADGFLPCTPSAVLYCLKYYGIHPEGKNLVILGRSNVVGKPLANMLLWKKPFANATVTVCHSRTANLAQITQAADILICAIGRANFVTADLVKENSILIDVGINELKTSNGTSVYVGDIDYKSCYDKALAITPVPGGIGRITTSVLFLNLVKACLEAKGINKSIDEFIALIFGGIRINE